MENKKLFLSAVLMMMTITAVGCNNNTTNSSVASSEAASNSVAASTSDATSEESQAISSSYISSEEVSSIEESSSETSYTNPMSPAPNSWSYDEKWGQKKGQSLGGTVTYETYYDQHPDLCDNIATYNYFSVNSYVDPASELALHCSLFSDENEKDGAEYFANMARKIVPDWDSEESKTSAEKQEANALAIYDYVVTHVYYDDKAVDENAVTQGYFLTGMVNTSYLVDNPYECKIFTVCRGYCNLINVMMNGIGLPCIEDKGREYNTITGSISEYSDHVWNEIYYGGRWHVVDATWESNVAGGGFWYNYHTKVYTEGSYDNTDRWFYDIIPDYSSWEDCRNYTNYYQQSHIIEYRNEASESSAKLTMNNGYECFFNVYDAYYGVSEVGGYTGEETALTLPTTFDFSFDYNGGKKDLSFPCIGIKATAFKGNTSITSVNIPVSDSDKLTTAATNGGVEKSFYSNYTIKDQAFQECTALTSVEMGNVGYIYASTAFKKDAALTSIKFTANAPTTNGNFMKCQNAVVYYPSANSGNWLANQYMVAQDDGSYKFGNLTAVAY